MNNQRRSSTVGGSWPSAVLENFYECPSSSPETPGVWCYTDRLSYAPGETIRFHINTSAPHYAIQIARDGIKQEVVYEKHQLPGQFLDTPEDCSVRGCNWPVAFELQVPERWRSGGYLVTLQIQAGSETLRHHHVFFIRAAEPGKDGAILLVAATSTWTAYNEWGGSNHYEGITGPNRDQFSPVLSTQRPFSRGFCWLPKGAPRIPLREPPPPGAAPRYPHMEWAYANGFSKKYASAGWASYESHFVKWAERRGYRLELATQHDLHFNPGILRFYKCVLFVGHNEYWSWEMRDAVDEYLESGGRVAHFAANFLWQIRLEDQGRTQVCYKYRARAEDPVRGSDRQQRLTIGWEAPEVGRPGAHTFGLNASRGVYAGWGACTPRASGGFTVYRPEHWAFAGTDLYYGDLLGAQACVFGYEVDGLAYTIRDGLPFPTHEDGAPDGIEILAMGLATVIEEDHGNPGAVLFIGDEDADFAAEMLYGEATPETVNKIKRGSGMIVEYRRGAGRVFNAGSCEWVAGLIADDYFVDRITRNVLDRFTAPP